MYLCIYLIFYVASFKPLSKCSAHLLSYCTMYIQYSFIALCKNILLHKLYANHHLTIYENIYAKSPLTCALMAHGATMPPDAMRLTDGDAFNALIKQTPLHLTLCLSSVITIICDLKYM